MDVNDHNKSFVDFTDPTNWNKLLLRDGGNSAWEAVGSFTPTAAARKRHRKSQSIIQFPKEDFILNGADLWQSITCEMDMFMVMSKRLFEMIVILWENVVDDSFLRRYSSIE